MEFWFELGRRMGFEEYFPWTSSEGYRETLLQQTGGSVEEEPEGISFYYPKKWIYHRYEKEGFRTPSGKVEIYSQFLKNHGVDPLPIYREPSESPVSRPDLAKRHPLILTTGAMKRAYQHSQFHDISDLRALRPENVFEINPKDAHKYGIQNGDVVLVQSPRGKIKLKAKYTDILEGVVSMMHGWPEANANILTDDAALDPVTGSPGCKSCLCRVDRAT